MRCCLFIATVAIGLAACQAEDSRGEPRTGDDLGTATESADNETGSQAKTEGCHEMDLLFILDNSASMASVQANLVYNFPKFVGVLENYNDAKGGTLEYRLGVTTSSVTRDFITTLRSSDFEQPFSTTGDDGVLIGKDACDLAEPWTEGPSTQFKEEFSCLAELRTNQTSIIEMPLAALELALGHNSAPGGPNAGFFTPKTDALLVAIIITNEEDCSIENGGRLMFDGAGMCDDEGSEGLYTPQRVKAFLDDLTGGEGRYVMLVIAGPGPGKCESIFGEAWDAVRLRKMVDELGDFGVFGSLCEDDLWLTLESTLNTITATCDDLPPVV